MEVECVDRNGKANGNADGGRNGVPQNTAADWLLHIDSDELFHIGEGTVHDHFADLYSDNVWQMTHEPRGCPGGYPRQAWGIVVENLLSKM